MNNVEANDLKIAARPKASSDTSSKFLEKFYVHVLTFAPIAKLAIIAICLLKAYIYDAYAAINKMDAEPITIYATIAIIVLLIIAYIAMVMRDKLAGKIANRVLGTLAAISIGVLIATTYPDLMTKITELYYG